MLDRAMVSRGVLLRRTATVLAVFVAVAGVAAGTAEAAEKIKFKNGHTIYAQSMRTEGETVFLKLPNGSEVGFPKDLILDVEGDKALPASAYGPTNGVARGQRISPLSQFQLSSSRGERVIGQGVLSGSSDKPPTVGFSFGGSVNAGGPDPDSREFARGVDMRRRQGSIVSPIGGDGSANQLGGMPATQAEVQGQTIQVREADTSARNPGAI